MTDIASQTAFARLEQLIGRPVVTVANGPAGQARGTTVARVPYASSLATREEFSQWMSAWALTGLIG